MFKLGVFLLMWSALGLVGLVYWFGLEAEQVRIDSRCYYYTKNGTPTSIIIGGEEYHLNPDGSIDAVERPFVNPFHEEELRSLTDDDCIYINTK